MTIAELARTPKAAVAPPVPTNPLPKGHLRAHRWHLVEGDQVRELTAVPAMSRPEIEAIYPGAVVQMDMRTQKPADKRDVQAAIAWGLLAGEKDPAVLEALASPDGLAWLRQCGMQRFLATPEQAIADLTDADAIAVATVIVEKVDLPAPLRRVLATLMPAVAAPYGAEADRAKHARAVLRMVAADPSVRARYLTGAHQ